MDILSRITRKNNLFSWGLTRESCCSFYPFVRVTLRMNREIVRKIFLDIDILTTLDKNGKIVRKRTLSLNNEIKKPRRASWKKYTEIKLCENLLEESHTPDSHFRRPGL